jgi:hypothetical protein
MTWQGSMVEYLRFKIRISSVRHLFHCLTQENPVCQWVRNEVDLRIMKTDPKIANKKNQLNQTKTPGLKPNEKTFNESTN